MLNTYAIYRVWGCGWRSFAMLMLIAACFAVSTPSLAQAAGGLAATPAESSPDDPGIVAKNAKAATDARAADHVMAGNTAVLPTLPRDLSPLGMYFQADWIVKAVMIGLVFASVITWTVLIAKSLELRAASTHQRAMLNVMNAARTLAEASNRLESRDSVGTASTELIDAAATELQLSTDALHDREGLKERIASRLERIEVGIGRKIIKGTGVLATIGATAPFVGLFGTVWGIMNSFIGISKAQTTNLAVVAPGIAEALLATALGLVAAIPAVVIYNHFARQIAAYKALVADTSAAVLRLTSRDLSRGVVGNKANLHTVAE